MAATEVTGPQVDPALEEARRSQIAALTGMRGFAALMVVLLHTAGRTEYPWLGVHAYGPIALFVLSGFLLYRPFARWILGLSERPSVRSFAIRRATRIFPPFWAVLLVWVFVYPLAVPDGPRAWLERISLFSSTKFSGLTPGMEQTWSLGTELSWYVALPVLALVAFGVVRVTPMRWRLPVHALLLVSSLPLSVGWMAYVNTHDLASQQMWLPAFLVCFAFGALVALVLEAERGGLLAMPRARRVLADPFLLPGLAVVFVLVATSEWSGPLDFTPLTLTEDLTRNGAALGLAGTLLLVSVFAGPRSLVVRFLSTRFMQATGRWSYGIYLWHLPVIVVLAEDVSFAGGPLGLLQWLLVVVPISYVLGALTFAWVETPTMDWSRRQSARFNNPRPKRRAVRA